LPRADPRDWAWRADAEVHRFRLSAEAGRAGALGDALAAAREHQDLAAALPAVAAKESSESTGSSWRAAARFERPERPAMAPRDCSPQDGSLAAPGALLQMALAAADPKEFVPGGAMVPDARESPEDEASPALDRSTRAAAAAACELPAAPLWAAPGAALPLPIPEQLPPHARGAPHEVRRARVPPGQLAPRQKEYKTLLLRRLAAGAGLAARHRRRESWSGFSCRGLPIRAANRGLRSA
jgi:hypothetical protein